MSRGYLSTTPSQKRTGYKKKASHYRARLNLGQKHDGHVSDSAVCPCCFEPMMVCKCAEVMTPEEMLHDYCFQFANAAKYELQAKMEFN